MTLDYKAIDVDNHYYEPIDSCTRHLPKEFKRRGVQMVKDGIRSSNPAAWICCSAVRSPRASIPRR